MRGLAGRALLAAVFAVLLAAGGAATAGPEGMPRRLSLAEAVNLALDRNADVTAAVYAAEAARMVAEQAQSAADAIKPEMITTYDLAKVKELVPRQAQEGRRLAEKQVDVARDALRLQVELGYFGVQQAREVARVREQAVTLAERQLEQARLAYGAGTRARTDVLAAEAQVA